MSEGQVCDLSLCGNLGVHRQESNQQCACITMQTADLSGKRLLCSEHTHAQY